MFVRNVDPNNSALTYSAHPDSSKSAMPEQLSAEASMPVAEEKGAGAAEDGPKGTAKVAVEKPFQRQGPM